MRADKKLTGIFCIEEPLVLKQKLRTDYIKFPKCVLNLIVLDGRNLERNTKWWECLEKWVIDFRLKPGQNVEMIIYFLTLVPVYKDESEDKLKLRFLKSYRLGETKQF